MGFHSYVCQNLLKSGVMWGKCKRITLAPQMLFNFEG
jgi:hypothetical protein